MTIRSHSRIHSMDSSLNQRARRTFRSMALLLVVACAVAPGQMTRLGGEATSAVTRTLMAAGQRLERQARSQDAVRAKADAERIRLTRAKIDELLTSLQRRRAETSQRIKHETALLASVRRTLVTNPDLRIRRDAVDLMRRIDSDTRALNEYDSLLTEAVTAVTDLDGRIAKARSDLRMHIGRFERQEHAQRSGALCEQALRDLSRLEQVNRRWTTARE